MRSARPASGSRPASMSRANLSGSSCARARDRRAGFRRRRQACGALSRRERRRSRRRERHQRNIGGSVRARCRRADRSEGGRADRCATHGKGAKLAADAILDIDCDIWIPAARPDVVRADNVSRLRTRLIPQGANIPCTPEAEQALHARGILVVPDFIANAGGVICAAIEYRGGTQRAAFDYIDERMRANTRAVLEESRRDKTLPRAAALALAERRVRRAMQTATLALRARCRPRTRIGAVLLFGPTLLPGGRHLCCRSG